MRPGMRPIDKGCVLSKRDASYLLRILRYRGFKNKNPPLRVDSDPNLPEFCSFLLLVEFYLSTVLIFWFKSSEFCSFLLLENRSFRGFSWIFWFLFFGNILIFCYSYFVNPKNFAPAALVNQCKSLVYHPVMMKIFSPAALQYTAFQVFFFSVADEYFY